MKVTLSEIKNNPQETNRKGKKARIQTNNLEEKEEVNIQPEQKKETRFQKMRRDEQPLRHLQMCQHPNHRDAGRRRGKARH